jgi:hypothetical protein
MTTQKTKLQSQLEARKPHRKAFDIDALSGVDNGKIVFDVLRNEDTTNALKTAYALQKEDAKDTPQIVDNQKHFAGLLVIATLYHAARDADKPDEMPAFVSPQWMRKYLGNHELDYLVNLYNRFVGEVYPGGIDKLESTEKLLNFARTIAAQWKTDLPDVALADFSHEVLVEIFIRMCVIWADLEDACKERQAMIESLRASGVRPKEEEAQGDGENLSVYAVRLLAETANSKQGDLLSNAAGRIHTKQQVEVAMSMLGWSETSPAWKRVIADI